MTRRIMSTRTTPGVGTLWHSKADRGGEHGLFVLRHVRELVVGRGRDVDQQVRLERDDGAAFDVSLAVLFADFAPHGAGSPTERIAGCSTLDAWQA